MASLPKDARELFDVQVPLVLEKHPEQAREVDAIYYFRITGDGGGEWTVDMTSNPPTCSEGDAGNAQCTVEVGADDFKTMLTDRQAGMKLYFDGKLKVITEDASLATKLSQFFDLAAKETA